jgi:CRISPR-associated protein Cas5d
MSANLVTLRVWGDFACFTRPEMKVERVSYPVMTPSAARGVLEAVFWEPQMFYLVDSIRIVKKGRWVSFRRNEVTTVISLDNARTWMHSPEKTTPIQAGGGAGDGTQRNMLALQDVEYLITAEVRVTPLANRPEDSLAKYLGEIERRAQQGKCFHRPGLGMREFAADFDWEDDADAAHARRSSELGRTAEPFNDDVGLMLYDVFDYRERAEGFRWLSDAEFSNSQSQGPAATAGRRAKRQTTQASRWSSAPIVPTPAFFHAKIEKSRMDCHPDRVRILTSTKGEN